MLVLAQQPRAWWQSVSQVAISGGGGGYTGPGDVVASATAWYGFRAYNSADRGNRLLNVCNVADAACADLSSDASTGALVISTIGGSSCAVVTCTIKTAYDRSGNTRDATQATIGARPTLTVSCVNGLPCAACSAAASQTLVATAATSIAQPWTVSAVANHGDTVNQRWVMAKSGTWAVGWGTADPAAGMYAGVGITDGSNAADGSWHALQYVANGAASVVNVNDTKTTVSPGTNTLSNNYGICSDGAGGGFITATITEAGIWPSGFSSANQTAMCHNQFAYWGTSVSC